jgi:hypothetical protein
MVVRAIHDKVLRSESPKNIFGVDGEKELLRALFDDLAELNPLPSNSKFQGYGVNEALKFQVGSSNRKCSERLRILMKTSPILGSTFVERRLETKNM